MALHVRPLSESEQAQIEKLAPSRTASARLVERATIIGYPARGGGFRRLLTTCGSLQRLCASG